MSPMKFARQLLGILRRQPTYEALINPNLGAGLARFRQRYAKDPLALKYLELRLAAAQLEHLHMLADRGYTATGQLRAMLVAAPSEDFYPDDDGEPEEPPEAPRSVTPEIVDESGEPITDPDILETLALADQKAGRTPEAPQEAPPAPKKRASRSRKAAPKS